MRRSLPVCAGLLVLVTIGGPAPTAVASAAPEHSAALQAQPSAATYSLTPLLTGGILTTERDISLKQTVRVRQADPDPDNCNPYADARMDMVEKSTVTGLVDLGFADVPYANPQPPTTVLPAYTKVAGYMDMDARNWGCNEGGNFLATGGACRHTFTPGLPASIVEPENFTLEGQEYVAGESRRVTGWPNFEPGLACLMRDGEIPFAPGVYMLDYWGDATYYGAYVRPETPDAKDEATVRFNMAKTDTSCMSGVKWWEDQHSTGFYLWTGLNEYYTSEDLAPTCRSDRTGFAQTKLERALVVNEIKILQMSPSGNYVEVPPSEKVIDGNTVKVEMLIENQWREDITADIKLWDSDYDRTLETEKDQENPLRETFIAGAQKKVTFMWRTDGVAWETPAKPISTRAIEVLTPFGGARTTVQVAPRPALLVHGWNADPSTWGPWPGFVSSVRGDWTVRAVEGMNTHPRDGVSIQGNARRVQATIDQVRRDTGAVHVDLIGHSMGGLISRWYLSRLMPAKTEDGRPLVRSLTMMGTPNLGSDCANDVLNGAYAARATAALAGQTLETVTGKWIPTIQLTPAYLMGEYLAQTVPRPGVSYGYMGGDPSPVFACGVTNGSYGQEGDNDSVVVVPSLIGGGLGGRQIQPFDSTLHTSMGGSRGYFNTTLAKVVGLGPPEAVRLVSTRAMPRAAARPAPVLGVTAAGASAIFPAARSLTLSSPGGAAVIHVQAPEGTMIEVLGPDGTSLGTRTSAGWPQAFTGITKAGAVTVSFSADPSINGVVSAALSLPEDPRRVIASVSRTGNNLTLTARVQGPQASRALVKAVVNVGATGEKVVTLRKSGGAYTAKVSVAASDAIPIAVVARIGGQPRMAVLGA